jgi:hypothetical protein
VAEKVKDWVTVGVAEKVGDAVWVSELVKVGVAVGELEKVGEIEKVGEMVGLSVEVFGGAAVATNCELLGSCELSWLALFSHSGHAKARKGRAPRRKIVASLFMSCRKMSQPFR